MYYFRCFLKTDTHFIWAFIAPVIVIFLANIGFLIMAAVIMWRQQIMGITWIIGLTVVVIEQLLPLAYIFTTVAAFQGVFVFVVLVLLTKSTRDELIIWTSIKIDKNKKTDSSRVRTVIIIYG